MGAIKVKPTSALPEGSLEGLVGPDIRIEESRWGFWNLPNLYRRTFVIAILTAFVTGFHMGDISLDWRPRVVAVRKESPWFFNTRLWRWTMSINELIAHIYLRGMYFLFGSTMVLVAFTYSFVKEHRELIDSVWESRDLSLLEAYFSEWPADLSVEEER